MDKNNLSCGGIQVHGDRMLRSDAQKLLFPINDSEKSKIPFPKGL